MGGGSEVCAEQKTFPQILFEENENYGLVQDVVLIIDDQATNNCWTNSSLIKNKIKLTLEQSGVPVMDNSNYSINLFHPIVQVALLGRRDSSGGCFGMMEGKVSFGSSSGYGQFFWSFDDKSVAFDKYVPSSLETILMIDTTTMVSPNNFNSQANDFFEGFIADFASKVIAGRRSDKVQKLLDELPFLAKHVTREQMRSNAD